MPGKNWNSKTRSWSSIVGWLASGNASRARVMRRQGLSVDEIARRLGKSKSRIYEYLR